MTDFWQGILIGFLGAWLSIIVISIALFIWGLNKELEEDD